MFLKPVIKFFCSLRLTLVLLGLGLLLVFVGTLAQVNEGLYQAQERYFKSWYVYGYQTADHGWIPMLIPGGYLLGTLLLINLISAHIQRFKFNIKKSGIFMVHAGLILLLLGQLMTDLLSEESAMAIREGATKSYSENPRESELALVDTTDAQTNKVVAIPQALLASGKEYRHAEMPFTVRVRKFYANSAVTNQATGTFAKPEVKNGPGQAFFVREVPKVTAMDYRDVPSAEVELTQNDQVLGSWFLSGWLNPQSFEHQGRKYSMDLRLVRHYNPYSIQLLDFNHARYKGTDIPKDFSSTIRLTNPRTGEDRETKIYMNNPLRYQGATFYQQSFDPDDGGTILQVVRNPSWLTPYVSCILVGGGLLVQFLTHLVDFIKRKTA